MGLTTGTAVPRSADPFQDEQVDSFEVGTKMGLLDQRLFLNLSAFAVPSQAAIAWAMRRRKKA